MFGCALNVAPPLGPHLGFALTCQPPLAQHCPRMPVRDALELLFKAGGKLRHEGGQVTRAVPSPQIQAVGQVQMSCVVSHKCLGAVTD